MNVIDVLDAFYVRGIHLTICPAEGRIWAGPRSRIPDWLLVAAREQKEELLRLLILPVDRPDGVLR